MKLGNTMITSCDVMNAVLKLVLFFLVSGINAGIFETAFYPGSSGLVSFLPVPTKHTLIFLVTLTVLLYGAVNLFRRFYLERFCRDIDGNLYPIECKPTTSLLGGLFSLSKRWGIIRPPIMQCTQQHVFAGWAQAFTQCAHYWKRLGEGMVTITYYPEKDKYKLMMKTPADVVLINHELTKNMALFREENQGINLSRWSAIDFATLQPRAETFCLRWSNLGVAESFNTSFYKCTQPACYTDNDLFPLTMDKNIIPSRCQQMDFYSQYPTEASKFCQTLEPGCCTIHPGNRLVAPTVPYSCPPPFGEFAGPPIAEFKASPPPRRHDSGDGGEYYRETKSPQKLSRESRQQYSVADDEDSRTSRTFPSAQPSHHEKSRSRIGPQPSQFAPQSSRMASKPSRMAPQPSRIAPQPSRLAPQPSRMASQSSRMSSEPSRVGPAPSRIGGQPSRMKPQPSRRGPVPSQIGQQKSRIGQQKSKLAPTKSSLKSRKSVYQ